ncbi:peroxiredoxin [Candidatus Babeliales bacterium]|nr:peroxiredoxin [Candidatus Babeliales bacterium]MBP9843435.1 peroxiredoxin [Candidatus Babeliales bacterium]
MNIKYLYAFILLSLLSISFYNLQAASKLLGKAVPIFKSQAVFPDGSVGLFDLQDYVGKNLIIYFYPMDSSPNCTIQAKKFRDEIGRLNKENIFVVGVSTDSIKSHLKFQKKLALPFPLVSDESHKHAISKMYKTKGWVFDNRSTFLVNKKGIVFKVFDKVDIKNQIEDILECFAEQK